MTKKKAIKLAKQFAKKRMDSEWFGVYDVTYEELYGKDRAYAICSAYDLSTFYATETPVFSTG